MTLVDFVAQAIRIHDGNHTKGAAELAEIALTATSQYFEGQMDQATNATLRSLNAVLAEMTRPEPS